MSIFIVNRHCGDEDCDFLNITVSTELIENRMTKENGTDVLYLTEDEGDRIRTAISFLRGEAPENG